MPRLSSPASSVGALLVVFGLVLATACSSGDAAPAKECTPGKQYFCRCADLSEGEKICNEEGTRYEPCSQGFGPCPGGEAPDDGDDLPQETGVEACPGKDAEVDGTRELTFSGDTSKAEPVEVGTGKCGGTDGPENVYTVTTNEDGKIEARLQGLNDATLYVRTGECSGGEQVACAEEAGEGKAETVIFDAEAGKTYWLIVDSKDSGGKYTLSLKKSVEPSCGDGEVQTGEACDDGDKIDDNGCSNDCKPKGDAIDLGTCPGIPVHVWDTPVVFDGTTATMSKKFRNQHPSCTSGDGNSSPDRAFAVTAHKAGTLTVTTANTTFKNVVYARTDCAASPEIACAAATVNGGVTISFPVTSGGKYFVIVDGDIAPLGGAFRMSLAIQ